MRLAKYWHLRQPGAFSAKVIPYIDFTVDEVVQFDVPVVKLLL